MKWIERKGRRRPRTCERTQPLGDLQSGYYATVRILQVLDELPEAVTRPSVQVWSVLVRSLGEQGAAGRTALAWRWVLTGACNSAALHGADIRRPQVSGLQVSPWRRREK